MSDDDQGPDSPLDDPWTDGHRPHPRCGQMIEDHTLVAGKWVCPPSTDSDAP